MKSPFPGMDPYLERHWRDVHATLISCARERLNRILPADLAARTDDRVYAEPDCELDSELITEHFIEIIKLNDHQIVTAIEFMSPTN
jgi:hypothetical protein